MEWPNMPTLKRRYTWQVAINVEVESRVPIDEKTAIARGLGIIRLSLARPGTAAAREAEVWVASADGFEYVRHYARSAKGTLRRKRPA